MRQTILTIATLFFLPIYANSQPTPPSHAKNNTVGQSCPEGSAPISEATLLLLTMGATYTGYKLKKSKNRWRKK